MQPVGITKLWYQEMYLYKEYLAESLKKIIEENIQISIKTETLANSRGHSTNSKAFRLHM